MGYKSTLPYGTPMLTQEQKHARLQWAIQYKDDDWSRTIFTDETCYQLFRNTIRRWSRNPSTRSQTNFQKQAEGYGTGRHQYQGPYWLSFL